MAKKGLVVAFSMIAAASAASATTTLPTPPEAPPGTATTRYCMRTEAITGSRMETVQCWTREEWAVQEVNVDQDWPKEGVRVIG